MKEARQLQKNLSIGSLARKSGLSVSALRYYESIGLIPAAQRAPGGARYFPLSAVGRIKVVRRLQELGFSLNEMLALFKDRRPLARRRRHFVDAVKGKIRQCEKESKSLDKMRGKLQSELSQCQSKDWRCALGLQLGLAADEEG